MRPIDADALRGEYERIYKKHYAKSTYRFVHDTFRAVFKRIDNAPTIEAEHVRHGYWENANGRPKTYIRKCSVCGKEAYFCGRGCSYKFCPNCGADMRGDSDE